MLDNADRDVLDFYTQEIKKYPGYENDYVDIVYQHKYNTQQSPKISILNLKI